MIAWIFFLVAVMFLVAVLRGAPYVPTRRQQIEQALDLVKVGPKTRVIDLGSGDGAVLVAAAKRGAIVTGYEVNPILVVLTWFRLWRFRPNATIAWGDYWGKNLPEADVVYVFGASRIMVHLDKKLEDEAKVPMELISYGFDIPGKKPTRHVEPFYIYRYGKQLHSRK